MEKNKRIYYILMALAAVAAVLTAMACIVITDGSLLYTLAIVVPLALVEALIFMMLYLYPTLCERAGTSEGKKRKSRMPYVPDPEGFRWVEAGVNSLGFALIILCLALAIIGQITWLGFALLAVALLAGTYAANLYLTIRIHNIAGQPVKKRIARDVLLEAVDVVVDFFVF